MNTNKVIGGLIYISGLILLAVFTDDWKDSALLMFGIGGMIAGWELMDG